MRACFLICLLPLAAACEQPPAPKPQPRETADPVVIKSETDRRVLLSGSPGKGDFKINFAEPFLGFENRGSRLAVRNPDANPSYSVIDVARSNEGGAVVLRGRSDAVDPDQSFVLTIVGRECVNRLTGEKTSHIAWLGSPDAPRRLSACAAPAN